MTMYAVTAELKRQEGEWTAHRSTPTFYLNSDVQGIIDSDHAARIARRIVDPFDSYGDIWVTAVAV